MATKTTNYGLTKPAQTEYYDVDVNNNNMDIIDDALKIHTHSKSAITDFPTALKNPAQLIVTLNGTGGITYTGEKIASMNITASAVGAAEEVHTHSADDITSGTLSVARGGTGATTVEGIRASLELGEAALLGVADTINYESGDLATAGAVYTAVGKGKKCYVLAANTTANNYSIYNIADGTIVDSVASALENGCSEIILLPGTHNVSTHISVLGEDYRKITIRGISSTERDSTIINYTGTVTNVMRFRECGKVELRDFTVSTAVRTVSVIDIYGATSISVNNLYIGGYGPGINFGSSGEASSSQTIKFAEVRHCTFNSLGAGGEVYGNNNVYGTGLQGAEVTIAGNRSRGDYDFQYTVTGTAVSTIAYGNAME